MSAVVSNASVGKGFWVSLGGGIKNGAFWLGRVVKSGFNNYLVPAIKKIWPAIQKGFKSTWAFLKTAPGLGTLGCLVGLGTGISLLALAHRDGQSTFKRVMLRTLAVAAFVLGIGALATGLTFGSI